MQSEIKKLYDPQEILVIEASKSYMQLGFMPRPSNLNITQFIPALLSVTPSNSSQHTQTEYILIKLTKLYQNPLTIPNLSKQNAQGTNLS